MTTAFFKKIDAITKSQICDIINKAVDNEDYARNAYESACTSSGISDESRLSGEAGILVYGEGWDRVNIYWVRLKAAILNTIAERERADRLTPRKGCVVIDVIDCFDIKDILKNREYEFFKGGYLLNGRKVSTWRKSVVLDDWRNEAESLINIGVEVRRG